MKVVVYGLGNQFEFDRKFIEREFEVVAYSDKKKHDMIGFVEREQIKRIEYDFIYVTSQKYYLEIKEELHNLLGDVDIISKNEIWDKIQNPQDTDEWKIISLQKTFLEYIGKKEKYDFWYKMYKLALQGMNIGVGSEVNFSGEQNVIEIIKGINKKRKICFDVGANIGDYTREIIDTLGESAEVHCFEPAHETFSELKKNLKRTNIILNNIALSNVTNEATLFYDKEKSGLASLYKRQLDYIGVEMSLKEIVTLETIDNYCNNRKIEYIDLLKLDVEGNEYNVLLGAKKMLDNGNIAVIQIEFGGCNIDSRTYFRDFWNLLNERYNIYRILKDGFVHIEKYEEELEIFTCTNFCFISKTLYMK